MDIQIKIIKIACVYTNILKIIIVDSVTNFVKHTIVIFVDPIITKNVNFITQLYVIIIIIILINVTNQCYNCDAFCCTACSHNGSLNRGRFCVIVKICSEKLIYRGDIL